jgi:hypothetical protein
VFTGFHGSTNPWDVPTNSDVAERTHWQQGVVNYTHVAQNADDPFQNPYAAKALPVDVALGKIDTLDINNSYPGCVPIWHRLLNCGFRVPATAGTDCFLNRIFSQLPGGDRVYVQVKGPLTYADWIAGLKAGRSFVTSGPMLELTIDQLGPGEDIRILTPRKATVNAKASSAFPLGKVELLYNGKVAATLKTAADDLTAEFNQEVLLDKSGWLALRASAPGVPDSAKPLLYAHTNPIYVEVGGMPARSAEDARFFLKWIDDLSLAQRARNRIPNDEQRRHVQLQIEAARAVFEKMLKN